MKYPTPDPVLLLCELAEGSGDEFQAAELNGKYGASLRILADAGAVQTGDTLRTVSCKACDGDHAATVEFDPVAQRYSYFCPEAGWVTAEDADLATVRYNPQWLVNWLAAELPILSPVRRRALIPDRVWHLGDAQCGETSLTVVLARRVWTQVELDRLASVLGTVPPGDLGVVATSSAEVARQISLPHDYRFLDLRDVMRTIKDRLTFDGTKLGSWVKAMRSGPAKRTQSRSGRPSEKLLIEEFYQKRRSSGIPFITISAEATDIALAFKARFPDRDPPHHATIRKHIPRPST
jgi:hypothetical protein